MQPYKSNFSNIEGKIFNIMNAKTLTDDIQMGPPMRLIYSNGEFIKIITVNQQIFTNI